MLPVLNVTWHDSLPLTYDLPTRDGVHYRAAEYAVWANRAESLIFDEVRVA
jgi:lysophospholipase L1-like esterase